MKRLVLLILLTAPVVVAAQQADSATAESKCYRATVKSEYTGYIAAAALRYQWGYQLARTAGLYRSLADVRRERAAFRLRAGDEVFLVEENPRWLRVARHTYQKSDGPGPDTDTTVYYMRTTAIQSRTGEIIRFSLH